GVGSVGLVVNDAATTVVATNVTISTKGEQDSASGDYAYGVYNGAAAGGTSGGKLTLTNANVSPAGMFTGAVRTTAGGATTIVGGAFFTAGQYAAAVNVIDSGTVSISGASLTSSGAASVGLIVKGSGGNVAVNGSTITETGDWIAGQAQSV